MTDKRNVNCYICGEETTAGTVYEDRYMRIVRCGKCCLMYQNPQLSEESIQKINYKSDYFALINKRRNYIV